MIVFECAYVINALAALILGLGGIHQKRTNGKKQCEGLVCVAIGVDRSPFVRRTRQGCCAYAGYVGGGYGGLDGLF